MNGARPTAAPRPTAPRMTPTTPKGPTTTPTTPKVVDAARVRAMTAGRLTPTKTTHARAHRRTATALITATSGPKRSAAPSTRLGSSGTTRTAPRARPTTSPVTMERTGVPTAPGSLTTRADLIEPA